MSQPCGELLLIRIPSISVDIWVMSRAVRLGFFRSFFALLAFCTRPGLSLGPATSQLSTTSHKCKHHPKRTALLILYEIEGFYDFCIYFVCSLYEYYMSFVFSLALYKLCIYHHSTPPPNFDLFTI